MVVISPYLGRVFDIYFLNKTLNWPAWYLIYVALISNALALFLFYGRMIQFWRQHQNANLTLQRNTIPRIKTACLSHLYQLLERIKQPSLPNRSKTSMVFEYTPRLERQARLANKPKLLKNGALSIEQLSNCQLKQLFRRTREMLHQCEQMRMLAKLSNVRAGIVDRLTEHDTSRHTASALMEQMLVN